MMDKCEEEKAWSQTTLIALSVGECAIASFDQSSSLTCQPRRLSVSACLHNLLDSPPASTPLRQRQSRCSMHVSKSLFQTQSLRKVQKLAFGHQYFSDYRPTTLSRIQLHRRNPIVHKIQALHESRPRIGLWLHIYWKAKAFRSHIVESKYRKRLRRAFKQALEDEGFDEHGVAKVQDEQGATPHRQSLQGTMWLNPIEGGHKVGFADIVEQARGVIRQAKVAISALPILAPYLY